MLKACSRCGKIHSASYKCSHNRVIYARTDERRLRNTYDWQNKSKEIRERANYLCEICRDQGIITHKNLEVHHIEKIKEHPDLLLYNANLICVCRQCHELAEAGKISKDYLQQLAQSREAR